MKNITLSADEGLIEAARRRAAEEGTTLSAQFRLWLSGYAGRGRHADSFMETIEYLCKNYGAGGRKFTREEMNERSPNGMEGGDNSSFTSRWRGRFQAAGRFDARYAELAKKYLQ